MTSERALGDFVLKERLGAGGAGEVFLAQQVTLDRQAVVKVVKNVERESADRFLREVRIASRFDHPFAAHVYGFGAESDGTLWIAMELVRGTALDVLVKQQALPLTRFVPFFDRLCEVLQAAHDQGVVHRDIKPANIMVLTHAGRWLPKLLDFGVARRAADAGAPPTQEADPASVSRLIRSDTLELTSQDRLVGTPHYMSPEHWRDPARADARSDIYSLAILAYQALTGALPYAGKSTVWSLAKAHAVDPLPPLPASVPSALYAVLVRAAAKKPDDRYQTVAEFAAAFRSASGVGVEPLALPQLDRAVLDNIIAESPQPIAEAGALIEGARAPKQQLAAVLLLRRVLAHYLAVLALASRGRVGSGGAADSDRVKQHLRALATHTLRDEEWFALTRELCRPFAFRKGAHPLPELVSFFFAGDSDAAPGLGDTALRAFLALDVPSASDNDGAVHEALAKLVPALGSLLSRLAFVVEYPLVVRREENERWMGTRRQQRLTQPKDETQAGDGAPLIVNALGLCVLNLYPLLQAFAPSGGMPEELFFLEGVGRHGARMVALPSPFERQSEEPWRWFAQHVFDITDARDRAEQTEKPPYKGLSTFGADDADNYFGREREAESFANRLRLSQVLAVVGPSGTGKSSFILAGVLPLLPKGWRAVVARPGSQPFVALASKLAQAGLTQAVRFDDAVGFAESIIGQLEGDGSLILVIDQFEELLTLCPDPLLREAFALALVTAAEHKSGRLRVVLTLRDDFLIKAQQLMALRERLSRALQLLATPAQDDLLRVVTEPARRVGFDFDDPGLPLKMVRAVSEYPGALALLSFTASQLWELRDRQTRQMRAKTYESLGGVGGALAHHAEMTLAQMSDEERGLVREAFRNLVTAVGTRAVMSRKEMDDVLGGGRAAQSVIEKLVVARLLVTSETADGGVDRIEIIHEALIVSWPRLVGWQREDAETARLRDALRISARQWSERDRPRGLLWRADTLAEYKVWRARFVGRLTESEDAFAVASLRDEARGRRFRQVLAAAAFAALTVALLLILRAYQRSHQTVLEMRQEQGRIALINNKPLEALAYLDSAFEGGADNVSLRAMAGVTHFLLQGAKGIIAHHTKSVVALAVSPNGRVVASLDGEAYLSLATLATPPTERRVATPVACTSVVFSTDNLHVAMGCADGALRLIDVATGTISATYHVSTHAIEHLVVAGDDAFVTSAFEGARVVSLANGAVRDIYLDAKVPTLDVAVSPDRTRVVLFSGTTPAVATSLFGLVLCELGKTPRTISLTTNVRTVSFHPTSRSFAMGDGSGNVGVWDELTGHWKWQHPLHVVGVRHVAFSPDGKQLVSGAVDALELSNSDGTSVWRLNEQGRSIPIWTSAAQIAVCGNDSVVLSVDSVTGDVVWRHVGHEGAIAQCAVGDDGEALITAGADGTVRWWNARQRLDEIVTATTNDLQAYPDQQHVAIATTEGLFSFDAESHRVLVREPLSNAAEVTVSAAANGDVALQVQDTVRVFSSAGVLKETMHLPVIPAAVVLSPTGFSLAAFVLETNTVVTVSGHPRQTARIEGHGELTPGMQFLDDSHVAFCTEAGKIRVWDVPADTLVGEFAAHAAACSLQVSGSRIQSFGSDDRVSWRWSGSQLVSLERTPLPTAVVASGSGPLFNGLLFVGAWTLYGEGMEIAHIPLRSHGILRGVATLEDLWFMDSAGRTSRFALPHSATAAETRMLSQLRGTLVVNAGRLSTRTGLRN